MMRFLILFLPLFLFSVEIVEKKLDRENIFDDLYITYDKALNIKSIPISSYYKKKGLKVKKIAVEGSLDAILNLRKSEANIAIVRGDVLGIQKNKILKIEPYTDYGIVCSPNKSYLFLASREKINSILDFRFKVVSVGSVSNFGQLYLNSVAKNVGIEQDIMFLSMNLKESLKAFKDGALDIIFIFGTKSDAKKILKAGMELNSLPDDLIDNLTFKKGLHLNRIKFGKREIVTYQVPNFIIAPLNTIDENIENKIEAVISAFQCYKKIQNIEPFYGDLHPAIKNAISNLHKRLSRQKAIEIVLKNRVVTNEDIKYFYYIKNNSKFDMNVTFDYYKTKAFDKIPIKPRHLLTQIHQPIIKLKPKSKKMITFIYKNRFLYRIKPTIIEAIFENETTKEKIIVPLKIGDIK